MDNYEDVVDTATAEDGTEYRVRLEYDDSPEKPYDDGATPVVSVSHGYWQTDVEEFNDAAKGFAAKLLAFHERMTDGNAVFERYLRIFHGTKSFCTGSSDHYTYISYDTAAWRAEHLSEDYLLQDPKAAPDIAKGSLEEVVAWANGEVYGFIVEKNVADEDDDPEWEPVDDGTVWGHYGREWAEKAAKDELALAVKYNH